MIDNQSPDSGSTYSESQKYDHLLYASLWLISKVDVSLLLTGRFAIRLLTSNNRARFTRDLDFMNLGNETAFLVDLADYLCQKIVLIDLRMQSIEIDKNKFRWKYKFECSSTLSEFLPFNIDVAMDEDLGVETEDVLVKSNYLEIPDFSARLLKPEYIIAENITAYFRTRNLKNLENAAFLMLDGHVFKPSLILPRLDARGIKPSLFNYDETECSEALNQRLIGYHQTVQELCSSIRTLCKTY